MSRSNLKQSLEFVLLDECGKDGLDDGAPHTDPADPGGFTIWGLSKRAHPWITERTTRAEAEDVYEKVYWRAVKADNLPDGLDYVVFDFAVNAGAPTALRALKDIEDQKDKIEAFSQERANWYYALVEKKPALKKFIHDWITRTWQNNKRGHDMEAINNAYRAWESRTNT
jgi:hypothetical protein